MTDILEIFTKALLLKHSSADTRDTQTMPVIRMIYKTKRPGLRTIIKQEFGIDIQAGEHSSVSTCTPTSRAFIHMIYVYILRSQMLERLWRCIEYTSIGRKSLTVLSRV